MKLIRNLTVVALGVCLLSGPARAGIVRIGTLSFDTFIPGDTNSPGINAFNLSNLTGIFSLPPDFPVADPLTLLSASLKLTFGDLSQEILTLGDIGPGFLLDSSGNPVAQVPGDRIFASAEFTATLSQGTFALSDGTFFTADSTLLDVLLEPSSGPTLNADADQTTITVSGSNQTAVPEPSLGVITACIFFLLVTWRLRGKRA